MSLQSGPMQILLIEDSLTDRLLTLEALDHARVPNRVSAVDDGADALAFLRREGTFHDAPRPDLILLDLNMPRKDGREVLAEIKADPELQSIPVIVFSSSAAPADVKTAYGLHANCYLTKPVNFEDFARVVRLVELFWVENVTLPPRP